MNKINIVDLNEKPHKPSKLLHFLIKLLLPVPFHLKHMHLERENFKKIPKGTLIISDHMSFQDFFMLERLLNGQASYYLASVDEFVGKPWILKHLGCIVKKVHYTNMTTIKQIVKILKDGGLLSIYPEATYSFCGVTNTIDGDLGKLAKLSGCNVIVLHLYGSYIYSPKWNTFTKYKNVHIQGKAKMVATSEEVKSLSSDEINKRIMDYFDYDDYQYQLENNIQLPLNTRADNLHRILYKCPHCMNEKTLTGKENNLICTCGANYYVDELNVLKNMNGETKFTKISDWFRWEEKLAKEDLMEGRISYDFPVRIARLIDLKNGFDHEFAYGTAHQDENGIFIKGNIKASNEPFEFEYNNKSNATLHLTFDVKGSKEQAFEVHTFDETYVVYPLDDTSNIKIRFYVEAAHEKYKLLNKKKINL